MQRSSRPVRRGRSRDDRGARSHASCGRSSRSRNPTAFRLRVQRSVVIMSTTCGQRVHIESPRRDVHRAPRSWCGCADRTVRARVALRHPDRQSARGFPGSTRGRCTPAAGSITNSADRRDTPDEDSTCTPRDHGPTITARACRRSPTCSRAPRRCIRIAGARRGSSIESVVDLDGSRRVPKKKFRRQPPIDPDRRSSTP